MLKEAVTIHLVAALFLKQTLIEERMEKMDWNEIRETGHACYNCSHLKERKRYWVFLLRTYFHQREMKGLQYFFHETPFCVTASGCTRNQYV